MTTAPADTGQMLFRVTEAAQKLAISESKMWELLARGDIPGVKIDGSRRITRDAIEEYVARLARGGGRAASA